MIVMKQACLTILLALALLPATVFAESTPTTASCAGEDYSLTAVLTSSGMRAALTFSFRNTGRDSMTLLVHNVALDGECTNTAFQLEAAAGRTADHRCVWQKDALGSLTAVEIWAEILRPGKESEHVVLSCYPLGERNISRRMIPSSETVTAAYDDADAGVFFARLSGPSVVQGTGLTFEWYLINKGDEPLRFVLTALASGQEPAAADVLPHTVAYLPVRIPLDALENPASPRLSFRAAGYLPGSDLPLFQTEYELDPLSPRSVPTMRPTAAPGPQRIGTVTIRKSGDVNVREEGSTKAKKVGSAQAGASYPCYGVASTGWYLIELEDGTRGYVTDSYSTLRRE